MALRQELLCKSETHQQLFHYWDVEKTGLVSRRLALTFTFDIGAKSSCPGIISFGSRSEKLQVRHS
jgi:hypothetical protein